MNVFAFYASKQTGRSKCMRIFSLLASIHRYFINVSRFVPYTHIHTHPKHHLKNNNACDLCRNVYVSSYVNVKKIESYNAFVSSYLRIGRLYGCDRICTFDQMSIFYFIDKFNKTKKYQRIWPKKKKMPKMYFDQPTYEKCLRN